VNDLVLTGLGELVTNRPQPWDRLGLLHQAAVAVRGGRVAWVGPEDELPSEFRELTAVDAGGRGALPGFVDAHTHLVFAGDRSGEFGRRLRGETYEEILAAGGGIHATVQATRAAGTGDLVGGAVARVERMLGWGTTTVEIKSGYGLDTATEVRLLEAARAVGKRTPISVAATFMGGHVVDRGVDRAEYVDLVIEEMLPACTPLARACDVFCDAGAFTVEESARILEAGRQAGLRPKIHAEQLTHSGGARLAARVGALSADHLEHATADDAAALRRAGTVAVLLPGIALSMRSIRPPGRMLWDAGVTVALATDCNPGSGYIESMPLVVALACLEMDLTPEEAVWAATRGGALALGERRLGILEPGAAADLLILDAPSYLHLPYRPGSNLTWKVIKGGEVVVGG
jgi:imidazolonepropionase